MKKGEEYKKYKRRNIFVSLTRKKAKEEIAKEEKKQGRELSKSEKKQIIEKNANKIAVRSSVVLLSLGIFTGAGATNLLNAANTKGIEQNKKEISIDANEIDSNIEIKNKDKTYSYNNEKDEMTIYTNDFKNGLKVSVDTLKNNNENIQKNVENEIDKLDQEGVLDYVKEMFIKEYFEDTGVAITKDELDLYKSRTEHLSPAETPNGDEYYIRTSSAEVENDAMQEEIGVVSATIRDNDNQREKTTVTYHRDKFVPVYDEQNEVNEIEETTLMKMADVVNDGIDYYTALAHKEENSPVIMKEYKNRFVKSITQYKENKINQLVSGEKSDNKTNGYEIGD